MLRKILVVFIILLCMAVLSACGKKAEKVEETAATTEVEQPEVVPGEMALIPAGEFIMGSNDRGEKNDKDWAYPEHKVKLPAYWIDKYEVTNLQFQEFTSKTGYLGEGAKEGKDWRLFATVDRALFPVQSITWNDANEYCKSAEKRLPTEEEWEKAARGTDGRRFPWGNEWDANKTNTNEGSTKKPVAVGQSKDVSPFGVQDTMGNVQEWTSTWYDAYPGNPKQDPNFGKKFRVLRGLGANYIGKKGHIWDRSAYLPGALYDFGFRCAKDATPEEAAKAK
jgi:formylglycine-generating enzyme required for sulfatase activity